VAAEAGQRGQRQAGEFRNVGGLNVFTSHIGYLLFDNKSAIDLLERM
jgi:hypothetical protein